MENAVKALSMAGSVLLSLMIIILVVFYYDNLRINEQEKKQKREEQIVETVNTQFETYISKRYLIGSEVLSLGNLAVTYNDNDYLNEGYKPILLKVSLNASNGLLDGALFNWSLSDTGDLPIECKLIKAYNEDNKKVEEALNKQYKNSKKEYKYGNHSFDFWFKWIKSNPDPDINDKDYKEFIAAYVYVTTGESKFTGDLTNAELSDTTARDLWDEALEYANCKNVIIDFSRLNFEVKNVKYDDYTGRIMEVTIEEVN